MEIIKTSSNDKHFEELRTKLNDLYASKDSGTTQNKENILKLSQYMDKLYNKIS